MKGNFYVVPTPVGNLKDITLRSIEVLKKVDIIYCEDTRHSKILMDNYEISGRMRSLHKWNEKKRIEEILLKLEEGIDIAYVSDAGTPGISDPISVVIREIPPENVIVLPGATAFVPALVGSGIDTSKFLFIGFLSTKEGEKKRELSSLRDLSYTLIFYESPHRLKSTLDTMYEILGDRSISIVREISKIHEEIIRTSLSEAYKIKEIKGEIVIIVEGNRTEEKIDIRPFVASMIAEGLSTKSILKVLKNDDRLKDIKRNEVYEIILELSDGEDG